MMLLLPWCPTHLVQHRRSPSEGPCFHDNISSACLQLQHCNNKKEGLIMDFVGISALLILLAFLNRWRTMRMQSRWTWWTFFCQILFMCALWFCSCFDVKIVTMKRIQFALFLNNGSLFYYLSLFISHLHLFVLVRCIFHSVSHEHTPSTEYDHIKACYCIKASAWDWADVLQATELSRW